MSRKRSRDNEVNVDVISTTASPSDTKRSRLDFELHPLQNVEIMSRIFSFCSVRDLKNCRLVGSRLWLSESLPFWRDKAVLMILPEKDEEDYNPGIILKDLKRIYNDKKSFHQFRQKPFKNYKLKGFKDKYVRHGEMKWVFDKLSSHMKYLAFKNYQFHFLRSFTDTIFLKVPDLVELKLECCVGFTHHDDWVYATWGWGSLNEAHKIPPYPDHEKLTRIIFRMERFRYDPVLPNWIPMEFLLKKIPNLEELRIRKPEEDNDLFWNWEGKDKSEETRIMTAIAKVRTGDNSKLLIKRLELPDSIPLTENGFTGPGDFGFPLEQFTGAIMEDVMHLKAFSETLKFLKVVFDEKDGCEDNYQPADDGSEKLSLPNLTELHIHGPPPLVFRNLNKLEVPKLKTLFLNQYQYSGSTCGRAKIRLANPTFANVTKLECCTSRDFSWCYMIDAEDVKRLSESMPNVLHAKMSLTGDGFRELCKRWPRIRTLTIPDSLARYDFNRLDDEAITGVRPDSDSNATPGSGSSRPPNITDLKHLTDFRVRFRALTEHSVYFGFLHCPRLYYLDVSFSEDSEEAEAELRKKVKILTLGQPSYGE